MGCGASAEAPAAVSNEGAAVQAAAATAAPIDPFAAPDGWKPEIIERSVRVCGVSLQWLFAFAKLVPQDSTTADVAKSFVLPRTTDYKCRMVDTIYDQKFVGPPTFFISHTWADKFQYVMLNVQRYFSKSGDDPFFEHIFVWMDIFAINQHGSALQDDLINLQAILQEVDKTLFCMDQNGVALTRIWCLYELWRTLSIKTDKLAVLTFFALAPQNVYTSLNVAKAQASVDSDRIRILEDIEASIGVDAMTDMLREAIVDSSGVEVELALKDPTATALTQVAAMQKRALMLQTAGRHAEVLNLRFQTAELVDKVAVEPLGGVEYANSLMVQLALALYQAGRHEEAATYGLKAVEVWEKYGSFPKDNAKLGDALRSYADLYLKLLKHWDEAEAALKRALQLVDGAQQKQMVLNALSTILTEAGKPDEAKTYQDQANALQEQAVAAYDTISTGMLNQSGWQGTNQRCTMAVARGDLEEGERLLHQALKEAEAEFGYTQTMYHGKVLCLQAGTTMLQYASMLEAHQEKRADMVHWYCEAFKLLIKHWSARHDTCRSILDSLVRVITPNPGRYSEAEETFTMGITELAKCFDNSEFEKVTVLMPYLPTLRLIGQDAEADLLEEQCKQLQESNPLAKELQAAATKFDAAKALVDEQKYAEAEPMLREVLEVYKKGYGAGTVEIITVRSQLYVCLAGQGRVQEGLAIMQGA